MAKKHQDNPDDPVPAEPAAGFDGHEVIDSPEAVERLQASFDSLRAENADVLAKYQRSLADFQNYQRRALANEREAREQATKAVAQSVLSVLDHADLALNQDPTKVTAEAMFKGFEALRAELLKVLSTYGIARIEPGRDDPFDPTRHSAVTHQQAPGVRPGHIVATLQAGYSLGEKIVRPAMVAVAPSDEATN